jgi:hypothetical protein
MTIRENVKAIRREILLECLGGDKPTTRRIQDQALLALISGMTSDDCKTYMRNYAKSDAQLDILMGVTGDTATKKEARAYLIANGTCGTETVTKFEIGVSDVLDQ